MKFSDFTLSATPAGTVFIAGYAADGSDNLRFTAENLPISTATQNALDSKVSSADLGTAAYRDVGLSLTNVLTIDDAGLFSLSTTDGLYTSTVFTWDGTNNRYDSGEGDLLYIEGGTWLLTSSVGELYRSVLNAVSVTNPSANTQWVTGTDHPDGEGLPADLTFVRDDYAVARVGDFDGYALTSQVGDRYLTSSTTSLLIGNGAKTLTVGTGLAYSPTQDVTIAYNVSNHMHASVTSYNSTTGVLVVDVQQHTGAGTYTAWTINVGGIDAGAIPTGGTTGQVLAKVSSTNYDDAWVTPTVAVSGITGLGTSVDTALAISVGSAGAPVVFNGAGGTPSSITLTNATGYPAATTTTAGTVPKLGATLTATDTGAPTSAQLYEAWMGAQRYSIRIRANDTSLLQSAFTGAGLAVASGVGRSLTSGATTGVARHSWNNGTINNSGFTFHQVSGVDHRAIPWGNRVEVIVRFQISAWAATTSGYIYVFFGVPTQIGADLSNRGIGFKIDAARAIKAVAHNGTSLTTSSGSLGTATVGSVAYETYRIVSDGAGAVSLYRDGTLLGSITGGPTATGAQNQCGLHVEIGNGGQSLTNTVMTGDMIISVAPTGF